MNHHQMSELSEKDRDRAFGRILGYHTSRYEQAKHKRVGHDRRHIGLELKFPVVTKDGDAADAKVIDAFWEICRQADWKPILDSHTREVIGVQRGEESNPDLISTTTGICVLEFSVAHCADLFRLESHLRQLSEFAGELVSRTECRLLGLGIQPKTPPGPSLLANKGRHLFWDQVLPPRLDTAHGWPGSVELFTVIADNQVHVEVEMKEATTAVNVLNGLAGPQLALTANSSVWKGEIDHKHVAVREMFWDWWLGNSSRCGVPNRPFEDFADYVMATVHLRPVFIKREGKHLGLCHYPTFLDYYASPAPYGRTTDGDEVLVAPNTDDIDLHDRAFWWDARLSRFGTIESRVSCQQPPGELLAPAALVLGLVENLDEAKTLLTGYEWEQLRQFRVQAAHVGLQAFEDDAVAHFLLHNMLSVAERGLQCRGRREEAFLVPLWERFDRQREPARHACDTFTRGGVEKLIKDFAWR